jgi:DNA replication protein DnaC
VTRRETTSADRRARVAGLDADMTIDRWNDTAKITYDRTVWNELWSLRFVDNGHDAVIMGPVGVGKTFVATALGHAAVRRRFSVHFERGDRLLKRLGASLLDNSYDSEMRRLVRVDLLIIDDFALQALDPLHTADIHELIVERHRVASTVVTSNREPVEWLGVMADALLAHSAIDRLQSADHHELVLDGESYRQRQLVRTRWARSSRCRRAGTSGTARGQRPVDVEAARRPPRLQERLLHRVPGQLGVEEVAQGHGQQRAGEPASELAEGVGVAVAEAPAELGIVERRAHGRAAGGQARAPALDVSPTVDRAADHDLGVKHDGPRRIGRCDSQRGPDRYTRRWWPPTAE